MLSAGQRAEQANRNKSRYKIIADLMAGKDTDITVDPEIFATINRERISLEEFMSCHPNDVKEAEEGAKYRREIDPKWWNSKSQSKMGHMGCVPFCVSNLFWEVYPDMKERGKAYKRFFNSFPKFRISDSKI